MKKSSFKRVGWPLKMDERNNELVLKSPASRDKLAR